mmetsp:Transcript_10077/g.18341  ORF Transcript_10077/g.18341 Transcript_10077/m.18341 type:complete len:208 (-) Transcript_10077:314-937(-)
MRGDSRLVEHLQHLLEAAVPEHVLVHQERLERVAGGGVVRLGVPDDLERHFHVALRVQVHVADAVRVAHDRDLGVVLNVLHELVGASGYAQINNVLHFEQRRHFVPPAHQHAALRGGLAVHGDGLLHQPVEHRVAPGRLLAPLEQQRVAAGDGKACDLRQRVGPRLEDDEQDSDGDRLFQQHQAVGDLGFSQNSPQGILVGQLADAR